MENTISDGELEKYSEFSTIVDQAHLLGEERQRTLIEGMMISVRKSMQPPDGKRRLPRVKCDMAVEYAAEKRMFGGRVTDINEDGMFIRTKDARPPGSEVKIIGGRNRDQAPIIFDDSVVRTRANGFVALFTNLNFYTDRLLQEAVKRLRAAYQGGEQT